MANLGLKAELRDGETIRAYLDELLLLKTPVQLWIPQSDALPFETTIGRLTGDTFLTTTTPPLPLGQTVYLSFLLESRRFNALTQVVSTGVFRIPASITEGERRERFRATFARTEGIQVLALEQVTGTFIQGRIVLGALLDLSLQGLRVALDDVAIAWGNVGVLQRGDTFDAVCIRGLPYTPDIYCRGVVAHVLSGPDGPAAGLLLKDLEPLAERNIERILARRFPTTFGQAFPKKKRKTDIADRVGAPVAVPVAAKAPEVVTTAALAPDGDRKPTLRPASAVERIRKASRRILILSSNPGGGAALADPLREDGFRHVYVAGTFLEARTLASAHRYDLVLLDAKVGGHFAQTFLQNLWNHGLLMRTPMLLVADGRDASVPEISDAVQAVHVHDRRDPYEVLVPVLHRMLLEDPPAETAR